MRAWRAAGAALVAQSAGAAGAIALAALVAAALVAAALLGARPWAVEAGAPGDAYFFTNTYPPERGETPLRWTREAAGLRLHGAYAGPLALELRLYREPGAGAGAPWPLALRAGEAELGAFEAGPGWRRYALALPPGAALAPLTLESATFEPGGGDARELGVALGELRAEPLAGAPPLAYALGRAAWLGALLALAGAAAWLLDALALGGAGAQGRPWRTLALTAGLGAALALWAWLGPASLAWALPTRWGAVGWGAAGVLGSRIARRVAKNAKAKGEQAKGEDAKGRGNDGAALDRRRVALAALAALALAHAVLLAPSPAPWRQAAALLILLAPGALAALALLWDEADGAELVFLAVAGGLAVAAMLALAIHALPGPASRWALLLAADGLSIVGGWGLRAGGWRGRGQGAGGRGVVGGRTGGWCCRSLWGRWCGCGGWAWGSSRGTRPTR